MSALSNAWVPHPSKCACQAHTFRDTMLAQSARQIKRGPKFGESCGAAREVGLRDGAGGMGLDGNSRGGSVQQYGVSVKMSGMMYAASRRQIASPWPLFRNRRGELCSDPSVQDMLPLPETEPSRRFRAAVAAQAISATIRPRDCDRARRRNTGRDDAEVSDRAESDQRRAADLAQRHFGRRGHVRALDRRGSIFRWARSSPWRAWIAAGFAHPGDYPAAVPVLMGIAVGMACGATNGLAITRGGIAPFIATLGMMSVARGLALVVSGGKPVSNMSSDLTRLADNLFGVPIPVLILAAASAGFLGPFWPMPRLGPLPLCGPAATRTPHAPRGNQRQPRQDVRLHRVRGVDGPGWRRARGAQSPPASPTWASPSSWMPSPPW